MGDLVVDPGVELSQRRQQRVAEDRVVARPEVQVRVTAAEVPQHGHDLGVVPQAQARELERLRELASLGSEVDGEPRAQVGPRREEPLVHAPRQRIALREHALEGSGHQRGQGAGDYRRGGCAMSMANTLSERGPVSLLAIE